jgi:toxin ParE1/3/4
VNLRIHRLAQAELDLAADWYEERERGLGIEFRDTIDAQFDAMLAYPHAAPCWRRSVDIRVAVIQRFPFTVAYRIDGERIVVLAVAHAKRRPGYWAQRR